MIKNPIFIYVWFILIVGLTFWTFSYSLFEKDIFWHLKAGKEITDFLNFQKIDNWSFTADGEKWINFQWLSTWLFYQINKLSGYQGIVYLRSFFICLLLIIFLFFSFKRKYNIFWATLVGWLYISTCFFRLQIRPELLTLSLFLIQIIIFHSSINYKILLNFIILILWANLHTGTVFIGILFSVLHLTQLNDSIAKKIFYSLLFVLTFVLTPQLFHPLSVVYGIGKHYGAFHWTNPDYYNLFDVWKKISSIQFEIIIWILTSILGGIIIFKTSSKVNFIFYLFLSFLTFKVFRNISFQLLFASFFLLPISYKSKSGRVISLIVILGLGNFIWHQIPRLYNRKHFDVSRSTFPVDTVNFLKNLNLPGRIFNEYGFGGYLLWNYPEKKVFWDGRDLPFIKMRKQLLSGKIKLRDLLYRYDIEIGLLNFTRPYVKDQKSFPLEQWALIFTDNTSFLYLKRVEPNFGPIEKYEYQFLGRIFDNLNSYFSLSFEKKEKAMSELNRCLKQVPSHLLCNLRWIQINKGKISQKQKDEIEENIKWVEIDRYRLKPQILKVLNSP